MSFYHNVFAREHNQFVDEFRRTAANTPDEDSGLRDPANPARVIRYRDVTPDELSRSARLVVSAEIAKIHTIEWTTQLLYDEPLFRGMNGNWSGLVAGDNGVSRRARRRGQPARPNQQGNRPRTAGIRSSRRARASSGWEARSRDWTLSNPDDVNGGVNHFGSPFNFPGGVRHRVPAAPAGAGSDRVPGLPDPQHDPQQDSGGRDVPRPGHRFHARAGAGQLGAQHGPTAARSARAPEPPALPAEPEDQPAEEPHQAARCRGAGPHPRPGARSTALQRVPPPVRAPPAHELRRLHRTTTTRPRRRPNRPSSPRRCARCTASIAATAPR